MVRFPTGILTPVSCSPAGHVAGPADRHAPPSSMAVPRFTDCNLMIVVAYAALALSPGAGPSGAEAVGSWRPRPRPITMTPWPTRRAGGLEDLTSNGGGAHVRVPDREPGRRAPERGPRPGEGAVRPVRGGQEPAGEGEDRPRRRSPNSRSTPRSRRSCSTRPSASPSARRS